MSYLRETTVFSPQCPFIQDEWRTEIGLNGGQCKGFLSDPMSMSWQEYKATGMAF